ncbi:MAG: ABC transporter ATP-binding protein [Pseudomonadota bacterium]
MFGALARRILGEDQARLLYRLLIESAWPHRWRYAVAFALMIIVSAMFAAVALLMKDVFNEVFIAQDPGALTWLAGVVLVIFTVRGLAMYGQNVILARVGNRIVADLQARLYDHILRQGLSFHEANRSGDLAVRISQNCNAARMAINMLATRLGVDLTTVIGMIAVMFWNDVTMSLIALLGLPVVFGGVAALVRRVRKQAREEVEMTGRILTVLNETVLGARIVKAFNLERTMRARAAGAIHGVRERADSIATLQAVTNPLMEVTAGLGAAAVLLYAGWRIIDGTMEVGTFISFLFALIALGDPARRVAQIMVVLRQMTASVEFIYEVLDNDRAPREAAGAPGLAVGGGELRFDDVQFAYGDVPALNGLSFTAHGGQVTALVGPSGAGKSTVLSLIERFYDPTGGGILIDGQEIREVSLESLRAQIGLVTQETFLFDDTVARNLAFGRPAATQEQIEAAARAANAHEFIAEMPDGYDTYVGEGGGNLSGGQRQRIAIGRAMLRDAPILLLDEATSALDAESEAHVQEALERLMAGRTTIVIAHRLATIRKADQIAVIDKGRLVEHGSHAMLIKADGLYARLARLQFGVEGEQA